MSNIKQNIYTPLFHIRRQNSEPYLDANWAISASSDTDIGPALDPDLRFSQLKLNFFK